MSKKIEINMDEQMFPLSLDGKWITPHECTLMIDTVKAMRKQALLEEYMRKTKEEV